MINFGNIDLHFVKYTSAVLLFKSSLTTIAERNLIYKYSDKTLGQLSYNYSARLFKEIELRCFSLCSVYHKYEKVLQQKPVLLSPFYRWGNWGTEKGHDFPKELDTTKVSRVLVQAVAHLAELFPSKFFEPKSQI